MAKFYLKKYISLIDHKIKAESLTKGRRIILQLQKSFTFKNKSILFESYHKRHFNCESMNFVEIQESAENFKLPRPDKLFQ